MWTYLLVSQRQVLNRDKRQWGLLVAFELFSSSIETVETKTMCYFLWLALYFDSVRISRLRFDFQSYSYHRYIRV